MLSSKQQPEIVDEAPTSEDEIIEEIPDEEPEENITESEEEINVTEELPAENVTEEINEIQELNLTKTIKFTDACIETCLFSTELSG